jgi:hypothetical protein
MSLYKKYIETSKPNIFIRMSISFNRDTYSWATGEQKKIGYQVTCTPVERGDKWESFTAFTGFNDCLLEIGRQSSKRLDTAIEILQEKEPIYLQYFKDRGTEFKKDINAEPVQSNL